MELRSRPLDLVLERPFTISRGTRTNSPNVLVEVDHEGIVGRGEGHPSPRYDQDQAGALEALGSFQPPPGMGPFDMVALLERFSAHAPGQLAARCALESALWDWVGRRRGQPVHALLGLEAGPLPASSYTISIDDEEGTARRVAEAAGWPSLKLKLGGGDADRRQVEVLRRHSELPFRVDANEAWSEAEAHEKIPWLAEQGCELVEQPLPAGQLEAVARIRELSPLPLVADEDLSDEVGPEELAGAYDAVNIKLMKTGGLSEAVRQAAAARQAGMDVMLGCFCESSLGLAASAQVAPLARWVDLDGASLLRHDPFLPTICVRGEVRLPAGPGLGVEPAG